MAGRRAILAFVALSVIGLAAPAEAARFRFNGAGDDGGIVWDGGADVRTTNSECGTTDACVLSQISLILPTGIQITSDNLDELTIIDALLVITPVASPDVDTACANTPVFCTTLGDFHLNYSPLWQTNPDGSDRDYTGNPQRLLVLPTTSAGNGRYDLTNPAATFLTGLASALDGSQLGLFMVFESDTDPKFRAETLPASDVPEPGALALLALGAAGALRRRRLNAA